MVAGGRAGQGGGSVGQGAGGWCNKRRNCVHAS